MAKRKFLVVAGQSNATAIGDAASWEDAHPNIALRSPTVSTARAPQFSETTPYAENPSLPFTFPGGPQSGWLGDGPSLGAWQTPDTRGKVVGAARFLTFYNPTPSYLNRGTSSTTTYPGTGTILLGSTPTNLKTSTRWQYDPAGKTITRLRTGTVHTIAAGWAGPTTSITVSPALNPPPETNELFTFTPTCGANTAGTELRLVQQFGGLCDTGSLLDPGGLTVLALPGAPAGAHTVQVRRTQTFSGYGPVKLVCRSRFAVEGQAVQFAAATPSAILTAVDTATETITLAAIPGNPYKLNDVVEFTVSGAGALPSGLSASTPYWVVFVAGNTLRVSTSPGGAPVNLGAGFSTTVVGDVVAGFAFTPDLSKTTAYHVSRIGKEGDIALVTGWDPALSRATGVTTSDGVGLLENERVRLSGVFPPEFSAGVDYYVRQGPTASGVSLAATPEGTAIAFSASTGPAVLTRMDAPFQFTIAATPGGAEVSLSTATTEVPRATFIFLQTFRGSLSGLRVRGLTGANAGLTALPSDIFYDSVAGVSVIKLATPFANPCSAGDTYSIDPPQVNGKDVPYHKFAMFLPWCPFEGRAPYAGPFAASDLVEAPGVPIALAVPGSDVWPKEAFRLATSGTFTPKLLPGVRYFTTDANSSAAYISTSYGGATLLGTASVTPTGAHSAILLRQEGKSNPFPPGFNYPNHYDSVGVYQPFDGSSGLFAPRISFSVGLAVALAEYYGEPMYVVPLAVGGTTIGHAEYPAVTLQTQATNWFDFKQLTSWAPTEERNIFSRFLDVLDAAKLAFEAQGDEGECVGIVWVQGEGDASFEDFANRYKVNARRLKTAMRAAIKDRGMFSRPSEEIRWIDPHCQTYPWPFSATVNAAKDELIAEDPYSATFDQQDLQRISELVPVAPTDVIHYSGAGMTELERRAYAALLSLGENSVDVEIANMALSLIGEPARVFSLDPNVDQSAQASECAKFYAVARDTILESHSWAFATKLATLAPTTKDAVRTDWQFAYSLPPDLLNPLEVISPGTPAATSVNTTETTPWWRAPTPQTPSPVNGHPYAVERDARDRAVLYTNVEGAVLRYNRRVTPAVQVPMKFKMAVARKLAALIAGQFVKGEAGAALAMRLDGMARAEMGDAAATDTNRQQRSPWPQTMPWGRD